jgi:hypothetical protein
MNAFKYGIGDPGRPIASQFTPAARPMFRNAMTRVEPEEKSTFVKDYFSFKNPESAERFAKISVNSKKKNSLCAAASALFNTKTKIQFEIYS